VVFGSGYREGDPDGSESGLCSDLLGDLFIVVQGGSIKGGRLGRASGNKVRKLFLSHF
jgi:hypothetical protein